MTGVPSAPRRDGGLARVGGAVAGLLAHVRRAVGRARLAHPSTAPASVRAADRREFRAALSEALRPLADPAEVQGSATRVLGEHLGASRVMYAEVVGDGSIAVVDGGYGTGGTRIAGRHRLDDFGPMLAGTLRAGRTLVLPDCE